MKDFDKDDQNQTKDKTITRRDIPSAQWGALLVLPLGLFFAPTVSMVHCLPTSVFLSPHPPLSCNPDPPPPSTTRYSLSLPTIWGWK